MKPSFDYCKKWLMSREVYNRFAIYTKRDRGLALKEWYDKCVENYNFINDAFDFNDTDEGFDFWNDLKNDFLGL